MRVSLKARKLSTNQRILNCPKQLLVSRDRSWMFSRGRGGGMIFTKTFVNFFFYLGRPNLFFELSQITQKTVLAFSQMICPVGNIFKKQAKKLFFAIFGQLTKKLCFPPQKQYILASK